MEWTPLEGNITAESLMIACPILTCTQDKIRYECPILAQCYCCSFYDDGWENCQIRALKLWVRSKGGWCFVRCRFISILQHFVCVCCVSIILSFQYFILFCSFVSVDCWTVNFLCCVDCALLTWYSLSLFQWHFLLTCCRCLVLFVNQFTLILPSRHSGSCSQVWHGLPDVGLIIINPNS